MSNISQWNIQAGSNTNAPPAGAPENMLRSAVNDTMREMMAATRRWYGDSQFVQTATGTANVMLLDTVGKINGAGYTLYTDLPILTFRTLLANTGPVTLNVDGMGTKNFFKAPGSVPFASGDIIAGQTMAVAYNATLGAFELIGPKIGRDGFLTNTAMIFRMATPPLPWVKSTGEDDSSFRLIGGAAGIPLTNGGTVGVGVAFGLSGVTGTRVLDYTMLPATGALAFNLALTSDVIERTPGGVIADDVLCGTGNTSTASGTNTNFVLGSAAVPRTLNVRNKNVGGTVSMAGGGLGHTHPMPNVKYVDVISAVRS